MIDFFEELSKFKPAREVGCENDGDAKDLADILFDLTRIISGQRDSGQRDSGQNEEKL